MAQHKAAYPSLEHETGHAEALVGDHLSVTNERVEFQRRLTDVEIARLRLKAGEVINPEHQSRLFVRRVPSDDELDR